MSRVYQDVALIYNIRQAYNPHICKGAIHTRAHARAHTHTHIYIYIYILYIYNVST